MKAEGSAQSADALHVRENCIQTNNVGLLELITPKVRQSQGLHPRQASAFTTMC